jgi:hypothetical protein
MPEGVGYSGSNVTANTGLTLNYVGDFVYAYSGQVSLSSAGSTTMLSFTSGKHVIRGTVQSGHDTTQMSANQTLQTIIKFNGIIVYDHLNLYATADTQTADLGSPIELVIPPYTEVTVIGFTSDSGPIPTTYQLVGRLYK